MNRSVKAILTLCLVYVSVCTFMWAGQRVIMYHTFYPFQIFRVQRPAGFSDLRLQDADGTHIAAWYHETRQGYPTVLFFHGSGGNIGNRASYLSELASAGFGVLAIDYRGYGSSEGSPTEQGFYQDARATIDYATHTLHLLLKKLVLYGESLGTGVAVQMGTEFSAGAVILQSPYTSTEVIAKKRYPFLPVHLLLKDRFDSIGKIGQVHVPLLIFHGDQDRNIPVREGKMLFAHANEPKEIVFFPGKGHDDLSINERVKALLAFSNKYGLVKE